MPPSMAVAGGHPVLKPSLCVLLFWIPASAGMTMLANRESPLSLPQRLLHQRAQLLTAIRLRRHQLHAGFDRSVA